ncbi:hypothetical protein S40288_11090 [Stachybotrys chartarum IBT 40288]|nr:hypothetical protein S40288_11090 [Stachybotrys chartarum IBT 40288]
MSLASPGEGSGRVQDWASQWEWEPGAGLPGSDALVQQACSIGHSISARRPTKLTPEQVAAINHDPSIQELTRKLQKSRQGSEQYRKLSREICNNKRRLKRIKLQEIRDAWTEEQAIADIQDQVQRKRLVAPVQSQPAQRPAQKRLVEAITVRAADTLEGYFRQRNEAIRAVAAYCTVEEGPIRQKRQKAEPQDNVEEDTRLAARRSVLVKTVNDRPTSCFLCVGKALILKLGDDLVDDLIREFYAPGDLSKHFKRVHLRNLKDNETRFFPIGQEKLDHKSHLQNHALRAHGTRS